MYNIAFLLLIILTVSSYGKEYCQPVNTSCWPNTEEINHFKASLSDTNDCLNNFPTYTSTDKQGALVYNKW